MLYVLIVSVELGGFLYAVGGMDSPRAGFWGAPLNTGHFILIIILSWLLHSALWLFWYCSRALLSTDQWVADSCTNARVQVCYHCHCELGFNWINPGSRRRQRFFSSFIISFNLIAYFVTFVWITNYHHRHHHIHHHLTGLVVPLLLTRVAFMWAEASARTRSIFH